jgi:hypothetical protein
MTIVNETNDGVNCVESTEVIKIDEGKVRQHVGEVVRQSVGGIRSTACLTLNSTSHASSGPGRPAMPAVWSRYCVKKTGMGLPFLEKWTP